MKLSVQEEIRDSFGRVGLEGIFRDILGWEVKEFIVGDAEFSGKKIASMLDGVAVLKFTFPGQVTPPPSVITAISKAVGLRYAERVLIIENQTTLTWLWPKKTSGGSFSHEKFSHDARTLPLFVAQRLGALIFRPEDFIRGVSVVELREKLRGSFDTSTVTKKFYEKFKAHHSFLADSISGLGEDKAASYATLLLNRLMFIYFLQKKEFLNQDTNFLQTCMEKVKAFQGRGRFFSFYKDLLLSLFFEGLNSRESNYSSIEVERILGSVPYVNGGLFSPSEVETEHELNIPDEVFESIFEFFDSFTWHLDTRPTGNSNEINPEVLGYIFEQYINFTSGGKKENGAYYTKSDVTGYMVGGTLAPRLLDALVDLGLSPLGPLPGSRDNYIPTALLHGFSDASQTWIAAPKELSDCWHGDPETWSKLDNFATDDSLCLPGETWVETFHRRERVESLRAEIRDGKVATINDLVTHNLNSQQLLLDTIANLDESEDLENFWQSLSRLSVIDPTCGSGAFLFAALEALEDVYAKALDVAEELAPTSKFAAKLLSEVSTHPNRRYFIRKTAALNNLYGTDLMPDAIETSKLRVFLALAACLDANDVIEPLPDLDFNFKAGNLIVGFKDVADIERLSSNDLTSKLALSGLEPTINQYVAVYQDFVSDNMQNSSSPAAKKQLKDLNQTLVTSCNEALAQMLFIGPDKISGWLEEKKPFHWFAEFPQVFQRGGFDVVIGNPPYVKRSELDLADLRGYATADAADLYAVCYERSLSLMAAKGRHAFIVMLSLSFSGAFDSLRKTIYDNNFAEWWSSYGAWPVGLFPGVRVRNTILILGPTQSDQKERYSSSHKISTSETAKWLFESLDYARSSRTGSSAPIRGGIVQPLLETLESLPYKRMNANGESVFIRTTATYWVPVFFFQPRILDSSLSYSETLDTQVKEIRLEGMETQSLVGSALSTKLAYAWWSSSGDDFHYLSKSSDPIRALVQAAWNEDLALKSSLLEQATRSSYFASVNAGKYYIGLRWNSIRDITDGFEKELLNAAGLIEHWRNLNIWYRQTMRATRANLNSTPIPSSLVDAFIASDRKS